MSHKFFRLVSSLFLALALSFSGVTPALAAPPANDNFADAEVITTLPFSATVDITEAGIEPDEFHICPDMDSTVWYSFTPTQNIAVRADTIGSSIAAKINLYLASGPGLADLTGLSCSISNGSANFYMEAGKTYYLHVGSATFGQTGTIQVNLEQIFPPTNDNFADAEAIGSLPFTATADVTNATNEQDERQSCYLMDRTVWYSFTPTETMAVQVDISGSPVSANVNIYLSSGPGISGLGFALGCTGNNNDSFNFYAEAGKTYYLQAGFAIIGKVGAIQINLEQIFPPANDDFANAEAIVSLPFSTSIDISNATTETGELIVCTREKTVWYSFTPSETMTVRADTTGSPLTGNVNIYLSSGPGISDLSFLVGCSIDSGDSVSFRAEAGKTYYLQAGSLSGKVNVQINLEKVTENDVSIDIKPGRFPNRVKLTRNVCSDDDNVYVAILTTPTFDARTVDVSTLQFGDPNLSGKATPIKSRITDVDRDGDKDMVVTFTLCSIVTNGALNARSAEMILTGRTIEGINFTGKDSVQVVSPSYP